MWIFRKVPRKFRGSTDPSRSSKSMKINGKSSKKSEKLCFPKLSGNVSSASPWVLATSNRSQKWSKVLLRSYKSSRVSHPISSHLPLDTPVKSVGSTKSMKINGKIITKTIFIKRSESVSSASRWVIATWKSCAREPQCLGSATLNQICHPWCSSWAELNQISVRLNCRGAGGHRSPNQLNSR